MAVDPKVRRTTIPFNGGSITATRGLLEAVFGAQLVADSSVRTVNVERRSHSRIRVIGGATTAVAAAEYTLTKYGKRSSGSAAGGEDVVFVVDGDPWTVRLSGSHEALDNFLRQGGFAGDKVVMWESAKGTKYGPYRAVESDTNLA